MINIIKTTSELINFRKEISKEKTVGFVPTMGNLHQGHLSLIHMALEKNDFVFVSIFVNPIQFGPNEDYEKYPRTLQKDHDKILEILEILNSKSIETSRLAIFAPQNKEEIFPVGFSTSINVAGVTERLCGRNRPGHFEGVTTVVYQLFKLVSPQFSYFGEKDYQQLMAIKKMVNDLDLPLEIISHPTVRDKDGLALSSRNQFLLSNERPLALHLKRTLENVKSYIVNNNHFDIHQLQSSGNWEYLEVLDGETLQELTPLSNKVLIAGALKVGKTRLIDNIVVHR
jgi:pantoate--beta-alanine ligase